MDSSAWLGIYFPSLILFFIIIPRTREMEKGVLVKIKKRKGATALANELLKRYAGKVCKISTGSFGTNITGKIISVNENWLEVETRRGKELINADFVQNIRVR